jgi:hypothetical protein
MPKSLVRYQQTGDLHFITFSCYRRQPHLGTESARNLFVQSLEAMRLRYDFLVSGYLLCCHAGASASASQRAWVRNAHRCNQVPKTGCLSETHR